MKGRSYTYMLILALFGICTNGVCQEETMHTQGVMKQEFLNPAYNSFKDYTSISLMSRQQWYSSVDGSPKIYAGNVYVPVSLSGLGVGITVLKETIGLRNKTSISGSLSHNIRLGVSNYLAFGYGIGIQNLAYDMTRLKTYPNFKGKNPFIQWPIN